MTRTIAFAADHAGVVMKDALAAHARALGYAVLDLGTHGDTPVDYPDYGYAIARAVADGHAELGVVVCGSGVGVAIAANRHPRIRCAQAADGLTARLARRHNDANVLALGARLIGIETARDALEQFLNTAFEGGRHAARVDKLALTLEDITA